MPTVSVVVPTHNRASTLPRAIRSALGQTISDLELLVVDDASSDETREVVGRFNDDRVRLHQLDRRRGANAARNRGVEEATGTFISFLDSDDVFHPTHLERVLEVFGAAGPDCSGVFTSYELVRDGKIVYVSSPKEEVVTLEEMLTDNVIGGFPCMTLRTTVFSDVRPDETLQCWQDYDFFLRLVRDGLRLRGLDETLVTCHQGEVRIGNDRERALQGTRRFFEKHGDMLTDRGVAKLHYYRAFSHAQAGDLSSAREEFRRTIRADPTRWLVYPHLLAAADRRLFRAFLGLKRKLRVLAHGTARRPRETGAG